MGKKGIYDYDTMDDAKKIVEYMKRKVKEESEEVRFFRKKKDEYRYWLCWFLGKN